MALRCEIKPELEEPAKALIGKIWEVHSHGGGEIPLQTLFDIVGGIDQLSQEDQEKLRQRGALSIVPVESFRGRLINTGPRAIELDVQDKTVKLPKTLRGDYLSFNDEAELKFDDDATISICNWVLCASIVSIAANQRRLSIDMSWPTPDQCFVFRTE